MTQGKGYMRYLGLVVVVVTVVAGSADLWAQDRCAEAVAHVSGCTSFCNLSGAPETCGEVLRNAAESLAAECSDEQATEVLESTCAKLASRGTVVPGGNVCREAAEYMIGCFRIFCAEQPDAPFCIALPEIEAAVQDEDMFCGPDDEEEAMEFLLQGCDEINAMFGN